MAVACSSRDMPSSTSRPSKRLLSPPTQHATASAVVSSGSFSASTSSASQPSRSGLPPTTQAPGVASSSSGDASPSSALQPRGKALPPPAPPPPPQTTLKRKRASEDDDSVQPPTVRPLLRSLPGSKRLVCAPPPSPHSKNKLGIGHLPLLFETLSRCGDSADPDEMQCRTCQHVFPGTAGWVELVGHARAPTRMYIGRWRG
ncbi:hypothetical protein B0H11DRAFT_67039 [Mycena galericulata]|nr:hypothetical protein B0H11DRAFT_67039 [Mycena galericulata]